MTPSQKRIGLVLLNTGNGKGKTTAALGLALRAWGRDMRVAILQFLKSEDADYGEQRAAPHLGIPIIPTGDGCTWNSKDLQESKRKAQQGWKRAQALIQSDEYDLLILDEFTFPLHFGWLDVDEVVAWLRAHKPPDLHLVITGRHAPAALIEYADLVTEMNEIKHPLKDQGITAQEGIEF